MFGSNVTQWVNYEGNEGKPKIAQEITPNYVTFSPFCCSNALFTFLVFSDSIPLDSEAT